MTRQNLLRTVLASILAFIIFQASPAMAATFTVTNTADSGPGSLRQAVLDADPATSADTIVFDSGLFSSQSPSDLARR